MTGSLRIPNYQRESLVQAILGEIKSWPELHRMVFMRSHYKGDSAQRISKAIGINECEVSSILQHCERKLRSSLKSFKECAPSASISADVNIAAFAACSWYH